MGIAKITDIPLGDLRVIFGIPDRDSLEYEDITFENTGVDQSAIWDGNGRKFFIKPITKMSIKEYRQQLNILGMHYNQFDGSVQMCSLYYHHFSISEGETEKVYVAHRWIEGYGVYEEPEALSQVSSCFEHIPKLLKGLTRGERSLTRELQYHLSDKTNVPHPFDKMKWSNNSAILRIAGVLLKPHQSFRKEWYFWIPNFLLSIALLPFLIASELALTLVRAKGPYCDQSNAELFIDRPGVLFDIESKIWYLLEVDLAGYFPYPGRNIAKVIGRAIFPSAPSIKQGGLGLSYKLWKAGIKAIKEVGWELSNLSLVIGLLVHLLVQIVESTKDNQIHIIGQEKGKFGLWIRWIFRTIWAFFIWNLIWARFITDIF